MAGLLYGLRQLERWLHQHIFKVGWLLTRKLQTTTILYYAFFLPGIFLNQFIIWLTAGFLNVRADRTFKWPEKQEIGELRLDFVQLARNVGPVRRAIIGTAPFVAGLLIVGWIANNVLDFQGFLGLMSSGLLGDVAGAVSRLTSTPDFWIWVYLLFTISNTMMPNPEDLKGWWLVAGIIGIALMALFVIGAGGDVVMLALSGPIANGLNALAGTIGVILAFDLFMVAVLGTVEAIIERITGDSATFRNGKMITMRRAELLAQRAEAHRRPERREKAGTAGPPSVYRLPLPIPGAPGKESVSAMDKVIIEPEAKPALPPSPTATGRAGPAMITGTAAEKPVLARPETPRSLPPSASLTRETDEPEDKAIAETEDKSGTDEITYEDVDESA